jgi:hypothetical protein
VILSLPLQFLLLSVLLAGVASAQSPNGTINGMVVDPSGSVIAGAEIALLNDLTDARYVAKTNDEGIYVVAGLPPGSYRLQVSKNGFKTLIKPDIVLNVQDALAISFTLPIGATSETVTVEGGASLVNTESAAVSTIVDRQFAENLPLNGRSFQTLIQLTPGVVVTPSTIYDAGQFSVNGQRASANYWMVDGVSANIGVSSGNPPGNGIGGALGSFSALGGTNSLVSVDALQEFRIQTSTYAPEFGRTPGGQISIVTRSGTNQFHGTAFNYLRNDMLDANNWFNGFRNSPPLPKAEERQNDFGGTFGGRLVKNRVFFFFSYEGLRLRLPKTALTTVPSRIARQSAVPAIQPYLNAFPVPTGPDLSNGTADFNASFSNKGTLDAYSLRLDDIVSNRLTVFARSNYSPSNLTQRGFGSGPLSSTGTDPITTMTATAGATWTISPRAVDELRFNYSRTSGGNNQYLDSFGGAVPLASPPFPAPFDVHDGFFSFGVFSLSGGFLGVGRGIQNVQRQINLVDNLSIQKASHSLKLGFDFRRLSPVSSPQSYLQGAFFPDIASAENGTLSLSLLQSHKSTGILLHNFGAFAQDTWRVVPRLVVTYGIRWDIDFAPSTASGPRIPAVTGFHTGNLASLALAASGTPVFDTRYENLAPRLGVAYQLRPSTTWQTMLRGGFGVFFDLATSEVGNVIDAGYPFAASSTHIGGTFPLSPSAAAPPAISSPLASGLFNALDPNLQLPYTFQWNLAIEQALGKDQTLSVSYIGAAGRRLLQSQQITNPNPSFGTVTVVSNSAASDYNALQSQFQRRLARGLQTLVSYSWSHSIDDGSAGSIGIGTRSNTLASSDARNVNRGDSTFDVRNAFSAGLTYDVPALNWGTLTNALFHGWSLQSVIQAQSSPPVDLYSSRVTHISGGILTNVRPDIVPGQSLYLLGSKYPGGKAFNPAAFVMPPIDPISQLPVREGDLGRNVLRGFGVAQWDCGIHRDFTVYEALKLQFRAEVFNILNHPNFAPPVADLGSSQFGQSSQLLGQSLGGGNLGNGGFDPLYQIGGPRSIQLALKVSF